MNVIIPGSRQTGKTTAASKLVERLRANGKTVAGFLCPGKNIVDLATGEERVFLSKEPVPGAQRTGPYYMSAEAIAFGEAAAKKQADYVFIDEYGKLELQERGFYPLIKELFPNNNCIILVRNINKEPFLERFGKENCKVFELTKENRDELPQIIYKELLH
ncbi:hypothetical protein GF367_01970 [Candidatus Woesearchaeota archaeon]|nr:hypothetical protein [Candidatus Woesearchaeota archaeon]